MRILGTAENGRMIVSLTQKEYTALTLTNPGAVIGDNVNIPDEVLGKLGDVTASLNRIQSLIDQMRAVVTPPVP